MRLAKLIPLLLLGSTPLAAALSPGDTAEAVRVELGWPTGSLEVGTTTVLFFDRGEVVLRDDRVVDVNLMTEEELDAKRIHDAERALLLARIAEQRRSEREIEGLAIKQSKVDSAAFQSLPPYERVAYWKQFQLKYPTVSVELELSAALTAAQVEQAMVAQAVNTLTRQPTPTTVTYVAGWGYGYGYGVRRPVADSCKPGYRPGLPVQPIHPGNGPDRCDDGRYSNPDYNSRKGFVMAEADRHRSRIDSGYNANRTRIYRTISP